MRKHIFSLIAVMLSMLLLCSCRYPGTVSEVTEVVDEKIIGGESENTDSSETDDTSSEEDVSSEYNTILENVSSDNNSTNSENDDTDDTGKNEAVDLNVGEIIPKGNTAVLMDNVKGKSDKQAEAMRKEILNSKDSLKIKGTTYYISSRNGNDDNDGLTPETAWATADAIDVNSYMFKKGDAVLFERGCIYRPTSQIFCRNGITFGAYGKGEKPIIYGSVQNYSKAGYWQPSTKKNVWKLSFALEDAGIIVFNHGKEVGYKQGGLLAVNKNGDFYHNVAENTLYLYLDKGRPNQVYKDIEIGTRRAVFTIPMGVSDVTIDNICMKYSGNFGVQAIGGHKNITISNCEIGWIGGSYMEDGKTGRYGNGIQFWDDAKNTTVENCWVYQCYDTGITFQGSYYAIYDNVKFVDNLLEYHVMSIEFWDQALPAGATKKGYMKDIVISGNICRFAGYGWGKQRPNPQTTCHIAGGMDYQYDVRSMKISDNIFDLSTHSLFNWGYGDFQTNGADKDIVMKNNSYFQGKCSQNRVLSFPGQKGYLIATNQDEFEAAVKKIEANPKKVAWVG